MRATYTDLGRPPEIARQEMDRLLAALDRDQPPTAYLFRCRHCDKYLFYTDTT